MPSTARPEPPDREGWTHRPILPLEGRAAGEIVAPSDLEFLIAPRISTENAPIAGLDRRNGDYYLWARTNARQFTLRCFGGLLDRDGNKVRASSLSHLKIAEGAGSRLLLFAFRKHAPDVSWWDLKDCARETALGPKGHTRLQTSHGHALEGRELLFLDLADFARTGRLEARAVTREGPDQYTWQLDPERGEFSIRSHAALLDARGRRLAGGRLEIVGVGLDDPKGDNDGGEPILIGRTEGAMHAWGKSGRPLWSDRLCAAAGACGGALVVFSLDQGFANGLVQAMPAEGVTGAYREMLDRVLGDVAAFRPRYRPALIVSPIVAEKARLVKFIDYLTEQGFPFFLDVYTSDAEAFSRKVSGIASHEGARGLALDPTSAGEPHTGMLEYYARRYRGSMAGIRIFEILGLEFAHHFCTAKPIHPGVNALPANVCPRNKPYDHSIARRLAQFSRENGMTVLFSENHWYHPWQVHVENWGVIRNHFPELPRILRERIVDYTQGVRDLAAEYPGSIHVLYANNEGAKLAYGKWYPRTYRLRNWHQFPASVADAAGWGLSNQSWMMDRDPLVSEAGAPASEFALWASTALARGANVLQLEPFWYLWTYPRGAEKPAGVDWSAAGDARPALERLAEELGVSLPTR